LADIDIMSADWLASRITDRSIRGIALETSALIRVGVLPVGARLPLLRAAPALYRWRSRRRLLYWYGRLKALESVITESPSSETFSAYREEFTLIDRAVHNIPLPLGFADQYYILRSAIEVVRLRLASLEPASAAADAA
jgi:hypothetical protein